MIKAQFFIRNGEIAGFKVSGHAEFDDPGHDIACASVSSAVQMAANTITEAAKVDAVVKTGRDTITLKLPELLDESRKSVCNTVLEGMRLHIGLLSDDYSGFISIENLEV